MRLVANSCALTDTDRLADFYNRYNLLGSFEFLNEFEDDDFGEGRREVEAKLARLAADMSRPWAGRVKYVNVAAYFEREVVVDGVLRRFIQAVEPTYGGIVTHRDRDHIREPGLMRMKTVMRREVFASKWSSNVTTDFCREYMAS